MAKSARKRKKSHAKKPKHLAKIEKTMRKIFGIRELRPGQEEVIRSVLAGENTLAIMPTGGGKSLCYQIPALELPGTTIVVSPLISLMKDQHDKLEDAGIDAAQLNSSLSTREEKENLEQIERNESEFLFTTPERMAGPEFLKTLKDQKIDFVVIDESHCISQWGHDFRPSYLSLGGAIKSLGSPPVLALTATATPEVVADIQKQLGLGMRVINTGIYRPNLHYEVLRVTNDDLKRQHLVRLFQEIDGIGIVYCATVKAVKSLVASFVGAGVNVRGYHGKMKAAERRENQERFMEGALKAIIATNAFGMGIDKPDIRFVIHYQTPGSLEAYYQESGRAGRDGEAARCILLYQLDDRRTQVFLMSGRYPGVDAVVGVYDALTNLGAAHESVKLAEIEKAVGEVAKKKVHVILHELKQMNVVHEARYARFRLVKQNLDHQQVRNLSEEYERRAERDQVKLEQMMLYGQSPVCRWKLLHDYFNEPFPEQRCGHCDNCLHPLEEQVGQPVQP